MEYLGLFDIPKGTTWSRPIYFFDEDGVAIDISLWTIYVTVKEKPSDTDGVSAAEAVIEKDITVHIDPTNGESEIIFSSLDTDISVGNYIFDIIANTGLQVGGEDEIVPICYGEINISQPLTTRF
jgi:hypothetical protein